MEGLQKMESVHIAKNLLGRSTGSRVSFSCSGNIFFLRVTRCFLTVKNFSLRFEKMKIVPLKNRIHSWKNPKKYPWKTTLTLENKQKNRTLNPRWVLHRENQFSANKIEIYLPLKFFHDNAHQKYHHLVKNCAWKNT